MIPDTTDPSYWLNWRFLLCAIGILAYLVLGLFLIWKYEGFNRSRRRGGENHQQEAVGSLYNDEAWKTCLKGIHPAWLLAYRLIAFLVLLGLLVADAVCHGGGIFYFYTQWTFTLVVIYFGLGSSLSIYGCCVNSNKSRAIFANSNTASTPVADMSSLLKNSKALQEPHAREAAGLWVHIFQIIFQMCAGAVAITDCVFWLILYPFPNGKAITLGILIVCMHSVNAVFLLGDMALNCLRFPLFRFGYFVLWTSAFVIFQWIYHLCVSMRWPYPLLDLSSPYAPLWYLAVGLLHIPCYGVFALLVKLKHLWLARLFPGSFQIVR